MATGDQTVKYQVVVDGKDAVMSIKRIQTSFEDLGATVRKTQTISVLKPGKDMTKQEADALIKKGKVLEDTTAKQRTYITEMAKTSKEVGTLEAAMGRLQRTVIAFFGLWVFREIIGGFSSLISMGLEFNSMIETTNLGISSILISAGNFVDSQGNVAQGYNALAQAQKMSDEVMKQLQVDNLQTIATLEQLAKAFQQTLAPALERGFNVEQVRQYTVAMVQAAGALGLNLDMLAEETRSMLRGTISPRQTLIATALGIRNEDVRKFQGNAQGLFDFLMGKLEAFRLAGVQSQTTWKGLISNLKDISAYVAGIGFEPLFKSLKTIMIDITNSVIQFNEVTKQMEIKPEVLGTLYLIQDIFKLLVDYAKEMANYMVLGPLGLIAEKFFSKELDTVDKFVVGLIRARAEKEKMEKIKYGYPGEERYLKQYQYVPKPYKPTEDEIDQLVKIQAQTGFLTEEGRQRVLQMTKLLGIEGSISDIYTEQKSILLEISREYEKATDKDVQRLILLKGIQKFQEAGLEINSKVTTFELKTAEILSERTKDYDKIDQLTKEINKNEQDKLAVVFKLYPELKKAMDAYNQMKQTQTDIKRIQEQGKWTQDLIESKKQLAEINNDLDIQIELLWKAHFVKWENIKAGIDINKVSKEYLSILGQIEQNEMDIVRGKTKELRFSFTDKQISALQSLNAENMKTLGFYDLAIEAERILMEQQIKRFKLDKTYTEELGIQLNLQQSLKEYKTIFDTAKTAANLSTELANLRGSWVDIKDAELSLLEVEYKEMMALGDQNELVKTLTTSIYERKKAELEAAKAMDFSTLSKIGTQKYALQVTQDIVKSYEDFTKNIIEYGSSAVSGFFNNLTDGSTKAKNALNNMAKSFGQNIANMLVQMGLLIIKQQILKALGYDTTKTSKTGTEAAGQLALNAALAAQAIIVATLTAEYWALAAAKAAANVGGVSGGVSGTMTNYLFGGGESSVVGTRGGGGSESFGSGRNGRTTINYYQTTVLANDAKSFDDMVRRNPGSIIRVVNKDLRNAGSTRTQMKGSW